MRELLMLPLIGGFHGSSSSSVVRWLRGWVGEKGGRLGEAASILLLLRTGDAGMKRDCSEGEEDPVVLGRGEKESLMLAGAFQRYSQKCWSQRNETFRKMDCYVCFIGPNAKKEE